MDGPLTMSEIQETFRTPVRILLPKFLKSRDDWKTKSHQRKSELKSAKIKIRDVSASRPGAPGWRERTEQLQEQNEQLQQRLERAERERDAAHAAVTQLADAQKK